MGRRALGRSQSGRDLISRVRRAVQEGAHEMHSTFEKTYTWRTKGDDRVRESHQALEGTTVKAGEKFPNGCRYPQDPEGPDEEVYGCRCELEVS